MPIEEIRFAACLSLGFIGGVACFRWLAVPHGILTVLMGCFLLIPANHFGWTLGGHFAFDKRVVSAFAIVVGIVVFRRPDLMQSFRHAGRRRSVDLPMLAFLFWPVISWFAGGMSETSTMTAQLWRQLTWWGLPYVAGRLFFGSHQSKRLILLYLAASAAIYAPMGWFESLAGLDQFFSHRWYGADLPSNAQRFGGIRPQVFLSGGLELSFFYALASVAGWWVIRHRDVVRPWHPAMLLITVIVTFSLIAFRGLGGYLAALFVLPALIPSRSKSISVVLALLFVIPTMYLGGRADGLIVASRWT